MIITIERYFLIYFGNSTFLLNMCSIFNVFSYKNTEGNRFVLNMFFFT